MEGGTLSLSNSFDCQDSTNPSASIHLVLNAPDPARHPPNHFLRCISCTYCRHIGDEWLVTEEHTESYIHDITEVSVLKINIIMCHNSQLHVYTNENSQ